MATTSITLRGIDTPSGGLSLSSLSCVAPNGAAIVISGIEASHAPSSGSLANLQAGTGGCSFDRAAVITPAFWLRLNFSSAAEVAQLQLTGIDSDTYPLQLAVDVGSYARTYQVPPYQVGAQLVQLLSEGFPYETGVWSLQTGLPNADYSGGAASKGGQYLLACGYGGYLWRSDSGGAAWASITSLGIRNWQACAMSAPGKKMLAAEADKLYVSNDFGVTWALVANTSGALIWAVSMSDDGQVMVAASYGSQLRVSVDGGATWVLTGVSGTWRSCAVTPDGTALLAGIYGGAMYTAEVSDLSWRMLPGAGNHNWKWVAISNGRKMIATRDGAIPAISMDAGATWKVLGLSASVNWWSCAISDNGTLVVAPQLSSILYSYDYGATWVTGPGNSGTKWYGMAYRPETGILFVMDLGQRPVLVVLGVRARALLRASPVKTLDFQGAVAPASGLQNAPSIPQVLDIEAGGQGAIYGTVELYAQAGNIPLPRRVRLHRSRDGLLVRETWSDAQGNYRFDGISERYSYDVIAWDHEGLQQSVVANDLQPEAMP